MEKMSEMKRDDVPQRKKKTSCGALYVMGQSSEDEETKCQPHFHCLNVAACFVTNPSCASDPQLTLFGLSVTEAVLSAVQADTLYSLALGFAESEPCDRSSQLSVARRHLHHTEYPVRNAQSLLDKHACACPCAQGQVNWKVFVVNHVISAYMRVGRLNTVWGLSD